MIVYFAHPVSDYGTLFETQVLDAMHGIQVLNPNQPVHALGYAQHGMPYFKPLCLSCDACVFLAFPDGRIGAGVAQEIRHFLAAGRPVNEILAPGRFAPRLFEIQETRLLTFEQTRNAVARFRGKQNGGRDVELKQPMTKCPSPSCEHWRNDVGCCQPEHQR